MRSLLGDLTYLHKRTSTGIDRLARSVFDLFSIVKRIVDANADLRSLADPSTNTDTSTGRAMLAISGAMADVERELIKTRTAEGRSRALERGQAMGRPSALTVQQAAEARQRRQDVATLKELAKSYNVSMAIISRLRGMNSINAAIQGALNYSQALDFIFAIVAAGFLYLCRYQRKTICGLIEVIIGLYLVSLSFQTAGSFSKDFDPRDFDVVHLSVAITTYLGAIFVMVTGFDNIHSGWKASSCIR